MTPEQIAKLPQRVQEHIRSLEHRIALGEEQIKILSGGGFDTSLRVTGIGPIVEGHPLYWRALKLPEYCRFRRDIPGWEHHHLEVTRTDRGLEISCTLGRLVVLPQVTNVIQVQPEPL